jgi:hypothetical protein
MTSPSPLLLLHSSRCEDGGIPRRSSATARSPSMIVTGIEGPCLLSLSLEHLLLLPLLPLIFLRFFHVTQPPGSDPEATVAFSRRSPSSLGEDDVAGQSSRFAVVVRIASATPSPSSSVGITSPPFSSTAVAGKPCRKPPPHGEPPPDPILTR